MAGELARRHAALVEKLQASGVLINPRLVEAFRAVPRHLFLPGVPPEEVYRDEAIPTKMLAGRAISASSQPAMMAIMLEQLSVGPGHSVLEIGAGTGYNAALLGRLVGAAGRVVTLDIDDDIVAAARDHLAAAGCANAHVACADGAHGYAPGAPYDRIIVTAGATDIAPEWYEELRPGGRVVLPLRLASGPQISAAIDKVAPDRKLLFISRSVRPCAFMPLRGAGAGPEVTTALRPGLELETHGPPPTAGSEVDAWFDAEPLRTASGVWVSEMEIFGGLSLWLSLQMGSLVSLNLEGEAAQAGRWPCLFHLACATPMCNTIGLLTQDGLALLDSGSIEERDERAAFELNVVGYGPGQEQITRKMLEALEAWDSAQRPTTSRLRLRVYRPDAAYQAAAGEVVVPRSWSKLVVDWPAQPETTL